MVPVGTTGKPCQNTSCVRVPVGRAQSHKSGYQINAAGVRHRHGKFFRFRCGADEFQLVAKPLNGSSSHEYRTFQGIGDFSVQSPCDGGQKAVFRGHRGISCMHQQKTSGAVGVFGRTGCEASLSKEGRLLVASGSCNGNGCAEVERQGMTEYAAGGHNLGQYRGRDVQNIQNFFIPL